MALIDSDTQMPFLDHLGPEPDQYDSNPKQDVRLTQLGASSTRTSFKCGDAFGWATIPPGVPDPDSRVTVDTCTDLAEMEHLVQRARAGPE